MFCDHCGNQIEEKAIVCVKCGMATEIIANIVNVQEQRHQNITKKFIVTGDQIVDAGENLSSSLTLQIWMWITNVGFGMLIYFIDDYGPWEAGFYKIMNWTIIITNIVFLSAIFSKMKKGYEKLTEAGFSISEKN
jgi:hypothetical protein